ncbi:hypothetical protein [Pseudomonas sp. Irchel s3b5]|uniref:hypothetical protein n=1 Tax=Pseudomonas sp. Irchel s3b5 TaxID=2009077 RepID=UPI000BA499C2|nr:hypothetical protein [Pseudomonas sp. Irchel s3b5]
MKKDWVIWVTCICLFFAGGVYFNMLDGMSWKKEVGLSDVIGGISAVAAAVAAIAAWQSARISRDSAEQSRLFSRMQAYVMHRQQFEALLAQIEHDCAIKFRKKDALYNDIFPDNRHMGRAFDMSAHGVEVFSWKQSFLNLRERSNKYPGMGIRELSTWMIDQVFLYSNSLRFEFEAEGKVFYLGGIRTNIGLEQPMLPLKKISDVLNQILIFGMVDEYMAMSSPPNWFDESLKSLADSCPNLKFEVELK